MAEKMHYFRPVKGHAVRRCGTDTFIGASRGPKGYTWDTDVVVAIPEKEMRPYRRDYESSVRLGDLKRVTEKDYVVYLDKRKSASEAQAKDRADARAEAEKKAKTPSKKKVKPPGKPNTPPQDDSEASAS